MIRNSGVRKGDSYKIVECSSDLTQQIKEQTVMYVWIYISMKLYVKIMFVLMYVLR